MIISINLMLIQLFFQQALQNFFSKIVYSKAESNDSDF